jgi:hypothetical protein
MHTVAHAGISSWAGSQTPQNLSKLNDAFSHFVQFYVLSLLPLPKPSSELYLSIASRGLFFVSPWKKWAIPNRPPQSTAIILPQLALPTIQSNSNVHAPAIGPFAQARDTAGQEEEEEHADHNLRKVTIERRKKGLRCSTKMGFMRLRSDSYLAQMNVYLSQYSKEMHMTSDMFGLSNTEHLCRNAVLHGEW